MGFDSSVIAAMAKWPDVPDVYNWLMLDARGRYRIRARDYEQSGRFDTIGNAAVVDFIGRNTTSDETGRWYFQNGPQRVFFKLEYTPFVARLQPQGMPLLHTGAGIARVNAVWMDEDAAAILETENGPALVDDRDNSAFLTSLEPLVGKTLDDSMLEEWLQKPVSGQLIWQICGTRVPVNPIKRAELPARFAYVTAPQPPAGAADC
jgi:Protein of unknown function (DUF2946)